MKNIILALLTILPFLGFSQKQDTTIFNGAKKIIVKNSATAKENYTAAALGW